MSDQQDASADNGDDVIDDKYGPTVEDIIGAYGGDRTKRFVEAIRNRKNPWAKSKL